MQKSGKADRIGERLYEKDKKDENMESKNLTFADLGLSDAMLKAL